MTANVHKTPASDVQDLVRRARAGDWACVTGPGKTHIKRMLENKPGFLFLARCETKWYSMVLGCGLREVGPDGVILIDNFEDWRNRRLFDALKQAKEGHLTWEERKNAPGRVRLVQSFSTARWTISAGSSLSNCLRSTSSNETQTNLIRKFGRAFSPGHRVRLDGLSKSTSMG